MPKEPAATEVVEKEEAVQLKTGEPGTLASKLESPHPVFSGHPAAGGEPFEPEKEEPEGGEPEPEKEAKPEPEKKEEPAKAPEKKYKSWEEAEAGAVEHQRFATEKATEAARLREENETLKKQLEAKPPEKEIEKPPVKTKDEIEAETTSAIEGALEEIGQLDEFDPEYKKKVARAWAKAGFGGRGQAAIPENFEDIVEQRVQAALEVRDRKTDELTVRERANNMAVEAGLDMSEDSLDFIAFWHLAGKAPEAPFSEQVKWTIEEVRKKKGAPPSVTKEEKARVAKTQIENAPLEKGGPGPSPQADQPPKPRSLSQIVDETMQSRII